MLNDIVVENLTFSLEFGINLVDWFRNILVFCASKKLPSLLTPELIKILPKYLSAMLPKKKGVRL